MRFNPVRHLNLMQERIYFTEPFPFGHIMGWSAADL
jgi:hypothetical protein